MNCRDIVIGLILIILIGPYEIYMTIVYFDPLNTFVFMDCPTSRFDDRNQQVGKLITPANKSTCTLHIKRTDNSMNKSRTFISPSTIEGIHISNNTAKFKIFDILCNESICRYHEIIRVRCQHVRRWTKMK